MRITRLSIVAIFSVCLAVAAHGDNWPQWRGPHGDGVSGETAAPLEFSGGADGENVLWRATLPGPSGATPCVWEDYVFVTSADGEDLWLMAFDARDGAERWRARLGGGNRVIRGDEGNLASPSPCTDGEHVWCLMGNAVLGCYDFDGNQRWQFDLQDRYGELQIQFGLASTPLLHEGKLYLQLIHSGGAHVICLNAADGSEVWHVLRPSDAVQECEHAYTSPVLFTDAEHELLLIHAADYTTAHELADGREVWRLGNLNPKDNYNPTLRFIASPGVGEGLVVVPSAKNGPVVALRSDGAGDVTDDENVILWRMPRNTPDVPTPLIHDGLVYLLRENGTLMCVDLHTGELLYQERLADDRHRASPVFAAGRIYCAARRGEINVVAAGRNFQLLAKNDLGEDVSATPAFANGRMYVRTFDALYAIGE